MEPARAIVGPARPRLAATEVAVARRYLEHGFLDTALRLFRRNRARVRACDWRDLADRLMERGQVVDAMSAYRAADVPLPRAQLLALGRELRRKESTARSRGQATPRNLRTPAMPPV